MLRTGRYLVFLALVGCGGDDDDGATGSADASGGGATCAGAVAGDSAGDFSDCRTAINEFPEGSSDIGDPYWIYSIVAAPEAGSELDAPLESLGINLFIAGAPAAGTYALADALASTSAFVYAPYPTAYEDLSSLSLTVSSMEQVSEMDSEGYPMISYTLRGSLEMTLASDASGSVTVTASF